MTDTSAGGAQATLADSAKAAIPYLESIAKLAGAAAGEADEKEPESPITNEALAQLRWARKKYDSVVRWVLGTFAAIGLVIFGSLPFAQLTNVLVLPVAIGLSAAALGLGLIVWAASRAFEPEDASLGELSFTMAKVKKRLPEGNAKPPGRREKFLMGLCPPRKAEYELYEILTDAPVSHIGPGMSNVNDLIKEIGHIEARLLLLRSGPPSVELNDAVATDIQKVKERALPALLGTPDAAEWRDAIGVDESETKSTLRGLLDNPFFELPDDARLWVGFTPIKLGDVEIVDNDQRTNALNESRAKLADLAESWRSALAAYMDRPVPDLDADVSADLTEARRLVGEIKSRVDSLPENPSEPEREALKAALKSRVAVVESLLPSEVRLARSAELLRAEARLKFRGEARDLLLGRVAKGSWVSGGRVLMS